MLVHTISHLRSKTPGQDPFHDETALVSLTLPAPALHPLDMLGNFSGISRLYWESPESAPVYAGIGRVARFIDTSPDRFSVIRRQIAGVFEKLTWVHEQAPDFTQPRAFGGFSFDPNHDGADPAWAGFPAAMFILPGFQLSWQDGQGWITANTLVDDSQDINATLARLEAETISLLAVINDQRSSTMNARMVEILRAESLVSNPEWRRMVADAISLIQEDAVQKVVLSHPSRLAGSRRFDPIEVLQSLAVRYPDCYRFLFEPEPGLAWLGATPELVVDLQNRRVQTMALAGSIRRGSTLEEDESLARQMLADPKERHEHRLVVQAVEQHLTGLIENLQIDPEPGIHRLHNIQHLRTRVEGLLAQPYDLLDVVEALHPTPALGGTPREAALTAISEIEPFARGWYAAPIGWIDAAGNGQIAAAIRSALLRDCEAYLYAGAGIVRDSDPEQEWRETELKFRPMLEALQGEGA
jgi:menaquinone-specific isochorismate synthase